MKDIKEGVLPEPAMPTSYKSDDVIFLLKDLSGVEIEMHNAEREKAIQSGIHYSEMLPHEYEPGPDYIRLFQEALFVSARRLAVAVGVVAENIFDKKGENVLLASLARAGTPVGILIKRYIKYKYGNNVPHFSISIIRGKGFDVNAIRYILLNYPDSEIQFIDGWTGKGMITNVLAEGCREFYNMYGVFLDADLAVLADPGYCVNNYGTRDDFLIASACLNSTVSGLVSRTVQNPMLIAETDFHGAKYYHHLLDKDRSYDFIHAVEEYFPLISDEVSREKAMLTIEKTDPSWLGMQDVRNIAADFIIDDINLIKPGVGETTRVLLRRVPWKVLVRDKNNHDLRHIQILAAERGVPVEEYPLASYHCCGIIRDMKGDY